MALRESLAQVDLFGGLNPTEMDQLVHCGTKFKKAAGRTVVEQGSADAGLQLILDGSATVFVNGNEVGTMQAGEYFGEMSLLDGAPRSATLVAGPDGVETFAVSALAFSDLLDAHPDITRAVLKALVARIRSVEARKA